MNSNFASDKKFPIKKLFSYPLQKEIFLFFITWPMNREMYFKIRKSSRFTFLQNQDSLYVKIDIFLLIDIFQIFPAEGNFPQLKIFLSFSDRYFIHEGERKSKRIFLYQVYGKEDKFLVFGPSVKVG